MENLSYRRTVSTPGNELFLFFSAGARGGGGGGGCGGVCGELLEMNFELKHTSYSLPVWEAVKLTDFVLT